MPTAHTAAYAGLEERLQHTGLRIASLADLDVGTADAGEPFLRVRQGLWADAGAGSGDAGALRDAFETWR